MKNCVACRGVDGGSPTADGDGVGGGAGRISDFGTESFSSPNRRIDFEKDRVNTAAKVDVEVRGSVN